MRQLLTTAFEGMRHETPRHSTTFRRWSNRRKTLMSTNQIRFDDGAAYERYMGKWSQLAGETPLLRFRLLGFFAAFVDGQLFVQARDHLADAGFGEALYAGGVGLFQASQAFFKI